MSRRKALYRATIVLISCLGTGAIRLNADDPPHYSRKQLHQMMREARTLSDYQLLADYFQYQQLRWRAKAEAEAEEWFHCARNFVLPTKFPTRADSARMLWQYYSYKADKMASLAAQYKQKLHEQQSRQTQ